MAGELFPCTLQDALCCFLGGEMDEPVLDCVLYKSESPQLSAAGKERYVAGFLLD